MQQVGGQTAVQITEAILDQAGKGLIQNRFDLFAACFQMPYPVETLDCKSLLPNADALKVMFDAIYQDIQSKNVTELVRICEVAEFRSETRVDATHTTHVMNGNQRVNSPFPIYTVIERIGSAWRVIQTQYAVDQQTPIGRALAQFSEDSGAPRAAL